MATSCLFTHPRIKRIATGRESCTSSMHFAAKSSTAKILQILSFIQKVVLLYTLQCAMPELPCRRGMKFSHLLPVGNGTRRILSNTWRACLKREASIGETQFFWSGSYHSRIHYMLCYTRTTDQIILSTAVHEWKSFPDAVELVARQHILLMIFTSFLLIVLQEYGERQNRSQQLECSWQYWGLCRLAYVEAVAQQWKLAESTHETLCSAMPSSTLLEFVFDSLFVFFSFAEVDVQAIPLFKLVFGASDLALLEKYRQKFVQLSPWNSVRIDEQHVFTHTAKSHVVVDSRICCSTLPSPLHPVLSSLNV